MLFYTNSFSSPWKPPHSRRFVERRKPKHYRIVDISIVFFLILSTNSFPSPWKHRAIELLIFYFMLFQVQRKFYATSPLPGVGRREKTIELIFILQFFIHIYINRTIVYSTGNGSDNDGIVLFILNKINKNYRIVHIYFSSL